MSKCAYSHICVHYQKNGFTCNHDDEANGYCGIYGREGMKVRK